MNQLTVLRFSIGLLVVAAIQVVNASQLRAQKYEIDNDHTSVVFAISHFGLSYTYGRFSKCRGSFDMVDSEPGEGGFEFAIDADSIDTNCEERDEHLRSPDFFDVQQFPEITLKSTGIEKVDDEYQVTADLTILGKTRSIVMPTRLVGIGRGPFGKERAGFFTKFTIKRSEFGMDKLLGGVGDNVSITFSFEGIREEAKTGVEEIEAVEVESGQEQHN